MDRARLRRAARGARSAHAAHHRERLRAHRTHRPRRLGNRREPSPDAGGARAGSGAAVSGPRESHSSVKVVQTVAGVREALMMPREEAMRIGLVPTMGAFHEGHLTLFRTCAAECDVAVASLFVNPAQFGPNEDLGNYPRDLERDRHLAEEAGIDLLFAPAVEEIYPPGFQTAVEVTKLGAILEGAVRPIHFRGVATV